MSKDKIKTIELKYFRGATKPLQLDFDTEKSMVMIFGENGTGKSTIIDALDFVFNKQCGSLKEKSSTNIKEHVPSLGSSARDLQVSVKSRNQYEWHGRLKGSKPTVTGNINYLSVEILRRDKILKLINAEPGKRYEALKDFIELPNIRSSESSLRDRIRGIERDLHENTHTKNDKEDTLKKSWEGENNPGADYRSWAKEISKKEDTELEKKVNKYDQFIELIKKPLEYWEEFKKLRLQFSESSRKLKIAKSNLEDLSGKNQPKEIVDILKKTQSFLQKEQSAKECPACEQPIVPKDLQKRVHERLSSMRNVIAANDTHQTAKKDHDFSQKNLSQKEKELWQLTKTLIEYSKKEESINESKKIKEIFDKNIFLANGSVNPEKAKIFFEYARSLLQKLQDIRDDSQKTLNQLNIIKNAYSSLKNTEKKIEKSGNKKDFLQKILRIIEHERKTYVENLLKRISQDIETLYLKLHPNEGLSGIRLFLKPQAQASLEIKSGFQNEEDVPPQAYYSDSHLDTLGICVFIAMAKYFKNDIIVLDDVVTSLDQQHLRRFIQMLRDESKNFNQTILTTHYRPWREEYKFSRRPSENIHLIELSASWSLDKGIKSSQTKLLIEELEEIKRQEPFDRQNAGSKAGVFLESLLDRLSLLYELHAPRRPEPKYTLGELLNCFSKKLINSMKINYESQEISLSEVMNTLFEIAEPIRNQVGAHFNISGMDISDKEVMSFLDQTIKLGKALICSQCGGLSEKKKTDCWTCSCKQTKLYPLRK